MIRIALIVFFVSVTLTTAQPIINGGFEDWDTTFTAAYSKEITSLYNVPNPTSGVVNHWVASSPFGLTRTTDSYSGNYALILHNWYNYATEWMTYHQPINYRPKYFEGYFKYITGGKTNGLSNGEATVVLTRSNGHSIDTIATGAFQFDSTDSYTPFQVLLNYTSASVPDSIEIYFINSHNNASSGEVVRHLLYLDNLTLSETPLDIAVSDDRVAQITVYPNPVLNQLSIQASADKSLRFSLFNSLGEMIMERTLNSGLNNINLSCVSDGWYYYQMLVDAAVLKTGKFIKQ